MLPGDRLVCALVEPLMVGAQFKVWPLHVTIVPWFRLGDASEVIAKGLQLALIANKPVQVTADGKTMLGPRKNRQVRLLQPYGPLEQIEVKVRNYLHKKRAFLIDETTKKPYSFRPHVTAQSGFLLPADATFQIDRLYIVEQKGGYKEVVGEMPLG